MDFCLRTTKGLLPSNILLYPFGNYYIIFPIILILSEAQGLGLESSGMNSNVF